MHPRILDRAMQRAIRQTAARDAANGYFVDASHERRQIILSEMPFRLGRRGKRRRSFFA